MDTKTGIRTEKEKMLAGELYCSKGGELMGERARADRILKLYNATFVKDTERRKELLGELLGSVGENAYIEPNFFCDYGYNIKVGDNFFANYECIILDVCEVKIGSDVLLGPRVSIFTACHPLDPETRRSGLEYGRPVEIGDNVWIGGNSVINPGVKIGRNAVIGSGSVVTKDIPENCVAVGNPCRVIRRLEA